MAFPVNRFFLTAVLSSESHSVGDLQDLSVAIDGLVAAAVWGQLLNPKAICDDILSARIIVDSHLNRPKSKRRFFPEFSTGQRSVNSPMENPYLLGPEFVDGDYEFNPLDPMDVGVRYGINSFLRQAIRSADPELYERLFGFANVTRTAHNSPLLIEICFGFMAIAGLPAAIIVSASRAAVAMRKERARTKILEAQANLLAEEANQKRIQTQILQEIQKAASEQGVANIDSEVIAAIASIATTPVADLGTNPVIGSLTVGFEHKP